MRKTSRVFSLTSPRPITQFYYRCDSYFHLDRLLSLYTDFVYHGLLLVSGKEAKYYKVSENEIRHLKSLSIDLPNKHHKGGQSSIRFARLTAEKRDVYVKKMVEHVVSYFAKDGKSVVESLILAGPGEMKQKIREEVKHLFKVHVIDTGDIKNNTIHEVISKCDLKQDTSKEYEKLCNMIQTNSDILVFGKKEISSELEKKNLRVVYLASADEEISTQIDVIYIRNETFQKQYDVIGVKWYATDVKEDE